MRALLQIWAALSCFALIGSGCRKGQADPPPPPSGENAASASPVASVPAPAVSPASGRQTGRPAPPAPPVAVANPVLITQGADSQVVLSQLTQAARKYSVERRKAPTSLAEVMAAGYVQGAPQPPPGKKFVLDTKRMEVKLE